MIITSIPGVTEVVPVLHFSQSRGLLVVEVFRRLVFAVVDVVSFSLILNNKFGTGPLKGPRKLVSKFNCAG